MKKYAVIVAGGSGSRMGGGMPKQFRSLCGRPVLWWSLKAFHEADPSTRLITVLPREFISLWSDFYESLPDSEKFAHEVVAGGESRTDSVKNGLALVLDPEALVAVHDGARPLVKPQTISKGWKTAEEYGSAIPVVAVTDSLRYVEEYPSRAVNRDNFRAVQTPQVFKVEILKEAYQKAGSTTFTDDAAAVENLGMEVVLFEGDHDNIKITHGKDLAVATVLMGQMGS